jgi:hypothetical protein
MPQGNLRWGSLVELRLLGNGSGEKGQNKDRARKRMTGGHV